MNNITNLYFDTEFTGLHIKTTLISIGIISDNGKRFYAEFNDYDKSQVDEWIDDHVIKTLKYNDIESFVPELNDNYSMKSNRVEVSQMINKWLTQFDKIQWVSDVPTYDFPLLVGLVYGHGLKIPYLKHGADCHNINQDIARYYDISEIEAFDKSREDILKDFNITVHGVKHNSGYDADVIKEIYIALNVKSIIDCTKTV